MANPNSRVLLSLMLNVEMVGGVGSEYRLYFLSRSDSRT